MLTSTQILQIVAFLDVFSTGLIIPQLAEHAKLLGCNHIVIGIMGALYSGFQFIFGPITGSISDVKGRKPILLQSLVICGAAYVLAGLTSSIVLFLTLRSFLGIFKQTQLLVEALTPDYEKNPEKLSVLYGRLATLTGAGMSLGAIISGHVIEAYPNAGFTILSLVVGMIFAANAGLIRTLPKDIRIKEKDDETSEELSVIATLVNSLANNLKESFNIFYKIDWKVYWDIFLFKLLMSLCMMVYFSNFALFLKIKHQVSPVYLGYIVSFQGAIGSLCTYFIGYINKLYKDDKDFTQRNFHVFVVLTTALLGLSLAPNLLLYIVFLIPLAICGAISRVVSLEMLLNKSHGSHRGTVMGAAGSVWSISGVFAPLIAGVVGHYIGILYVIFVSILLAAVGLVISYRVRLDSIRAKEKSE